MLIDKSDSFVFGYSKLDAMFGRTAPEAIHIPYRGIAKPGVASARPARPAGSASGRAREAALSRAKVTPPALGLPSGRRS